MTESVVHNQPVSGLLPDSQQRPATGQPQPVDQVTSERSRNRLSFLVDPRTLVVLLLLTFMGSLAYQQWNDPQRYFELGMTGVRENDRAKIERAAVALRDKPAYRMQHAFLSASLLVRDGQPERAIQLAISSQDHPDVEIQSRVLAGEAAYQLGAAGNAKLFWEDALLLNAQCVEAHQWLGVLYFDLGAMENSLLHLKSVSYLSPKDPRPDRFMGLINRDYERPEEAIKHYLESLRRSPRQPDVDTVRLELAECHIKLRQYEAAMESLSRCADSPQKVRLTARCLMNLGSLDDARRLAQQILQVDPKNLKTLDLNAEIALIDGDVQRAADLLRTAVQVDPFDHGVRSRLAQVVARLGLDDEHRQHAQRAEELQDLWRQFSDLQVDAINRPIDADLRLQIGTLARQLGKEELALTWFKAAVAIDPSKSDTVQKLAKPQ